MDKYFDDDLSFVINSYLNIATFIAVEARGSLQNTNTESLSTVKLNLNH